MKRSIVGLAPVLAVMAFALGAPMAAADGVQAGQLVIYDAWARASAGPARTGAAYVAIHNHGGPDRLIGAATPVAERAELHTHIMEGNVMKMRPAAAIAIAAGARVALRPGGEHLMLKGLKAPLAEGASFPLTLKFEKAGAVTVTAGVLKAGAAGPGDPHGAHHRDGGQHMHHGGNHPKKQP